jgi:hypothetical protein
MAGNARFEKVKRRPDLGYVELYEYKAFLTPDGEGSPGFSYHCGDPGTALEPYTGNYYFPEVPAGRYSLMTCFGEFFPRGKVVSGIVVNDGERTTQDALQPIDYSAYVTKGEWDPNGDNPVQQTFIATGTSIARASFAKADSQKDGRIEFSIHEDNGGAIETWHQTGPTRSVNRQGYGADHWVAWDHGEVPTIPGHRYALRLTATSGVNIQPYWSDDSNYTDGTAYHASGASLGHDYYMAVFSDNDDTLATMQIRSAGYANLASDTFHGKWAQTYTAQGSSLAGAMLMATLGGASGWQFSVSVSLHEGGPEGPQIGPAKTMPCAYAPFFGVAGVSFSRGETPTAPGQTYAIVYEREGGFNASRMNDGDTYSGGTAQWTDETGAWQTQMFDLCMNIFEYAPETAADHWLDY